MPAPPRVQVTSARAVKVTPDGKVQLQVIRDCLPLTPDICIPGITVDMGPGAYSGCTAVVDSATYGPYCEDAVVTFTGNVDDDVRINGVIVQEGEFPFTDSGICSANSGRNGAHSFSFTGLLPAGTPLLIELLNWFTGSCFLNGTLRICPVTPPPLPCLSVTTSGILMNQACYPYNYCPGSNHSPIKFTDLGFNGPVTLVYEAMGDDWCPGYPGLEFVREYQTIGQIKYEAYNAFSHPNCDGPFQYDGTDYVQIVVVKIGAVYYIQAYNNLASPSVYPLELFYAETTNISAPIHNSLTAWDTACVEYARTGPFMDVYWGTCDPGYSDIFVAGGKSGTMHLFPCPPTKIALYIGNENAITDDDFEVILNGVSIANLYEADRVCGPTGACRGFLVSPTTVGSPTILGGAGGFGNICDGLPIALQYIRIAALNIPLVGHVTVRLRSIHDNSCGNYGVFAAYRVNTDNTLGDILAVDEYGTDTTIEFTT